MSLPTSINCEGRKVTVLRLHATTHITEFGNLDSVIKPGLKVKGDIEMFRQQNGVVIRGLIGKFEGKECFIPDGNIISCELE